MRVAIGCDHGGIVLKQSCIHALNTLNIEFVDCGTFDDKSVDYSDFAQKVVDEILAKRAEKGILLCGTGIGISIAANKFKGIRCAHVTDVFCAQMASEHNDANVLAMGGRITDPSTAEEIVKTFFSTTFASGRHARRVDKIRAIEDSNFR